MGSWGWTPCTWCGWWEWNPYIPDPFMYPLCENCLFQLEEWNGLHCHCCGRFEWDPAIPEDLQYPLCEDCLGLVRPPHLVDREWARCYWCGWWELNPQALSRICAFCENKLVMRISTAFIKRFPLDICAKIGLMLAETESAPKPESAPTPEYED